jgi:hypothetical protein
MPNHSTPASDTMTTWTTAGVIALPLSAVLLALGTLTPQPDQASDPDGWARFVTSSSYLASHIATNMVGAALGILGTFALTVLIAGRTPRLAPTGMLLAVAGQVCFGVPAVVSTFVTPAIGQAYLNGNQAVMTLEFPAVLTMITLLALLLTVSGNIVLGVAAARSGVVPRWAGVIWAIATVIFYVLGFALGVATTGASLPTQPVGAALLAVSGTAMAWAAVRRARTGSPDRRPPAAITVPAQR